MLGNYVSYLFVHGRNLAEIAKMSLKQIDAACRVYEADDRKSMIEAATCARAAQASEKDWKNFIKHLEKGS